MDQQSFGHGQQPGSFTQRETPAWIAPPTSVESWPAEPPANWSPVGAIIAWIIIIGMTIGAFVLNVISKDSKGAGGEDRVGAVMMELQGKYLLGAESWMGQGQMLLTSAERSLNVGSIDQRQRMVILAGELGGDDAASRVLSKLNSLILEEQATSQPDSPALEVTANQQRIGEILNRIFLQPIDLSDLTLDDSTRSDRINALDASDRQFLIDELGWYGKIALAPAGDDADQTLREDALGSARLVFILLIGVVSAGGVGGLLGLAGLVMLLIFAIGGRVQSGLGPRVSHHVVYAETFAVWMLVFFGIQKAATPALAKLLHAPGMLMIVVGFFASLLVLLWPVLRGVPWRQVRKDIGWTFGRQPLLEPIAGLAGYLMALPLLAIGVGITLLLIMLQDALKGEGSTFGPAGGPAHPIIEQLGGAGLWPKIQILILAAVAAPIVEETMFRGVLYRHLRDGTRAMGAVMSILAAGTVSGFLFAAIHPQGWVAIPALMGLAYAFVIVREWRGTLIPAMIIHGVSNGIVMTMLIVLLST